MITLRTATIQDLETLKHWDQQPHVHAATNADPNEGWGWEEELRQQHDWREFLIAEHEGRPIGFIQIIDPAREETHYWGEVADNLRAIDIWIGEVEDLGHGYGTEMMKQAIDRCFAHPEVTAIVIDPLSSNTRSHHFYERFGFEFVERRMFGDDDCAVYALQRSCYKPTLPQISITKAKQRLIIRQASKADAEDVLAYVHVVYDETNFLGSSSADFQFTVEQEEEVIESHRNASNKIFVVGEIEGEVVALLNVSASNKARLRHLGEFGLTVLQKYWGQGVGAAMLDAMLTWAKASKEIRKIELIVRSDNTAAIGLYQKFGFQIEGTMSRHICIDGEFYDAHRMGIEID